MPSYQVELATHLDEGRECTFELRIGQASRHLCADSRLTVWHDRERESDDVDSFAEQPVGETRGECGITDHDRDDRVLAGLEAETGGLQACAEAAGVREQSVTQLRLLLDEVERAQRHRGYHGRDAVREQVRTRTLP